MENSSQFFCIFSQSVVAPVGPFFIYAYPYSVLLRLKLSTDVQMQVYLQKGVFIVQGTTQKINLNLNVHY